MHILNEFKNIENLKQVLLGKISKLILELPDNKNIKRINTHCFVMNSNHLNTKISWAPRFYDYKIQYQEIADIIRRSKKPESILLRIIKNKSHGSLKFNPIVIKNIQGVL
jgi:hypothetical protein